MGASPENSSTTSCAWAGGPSCLRDGQPRGQVLNLGVPRITSGAYLRGTPDGGGGRGECPGYSLISKNF